MNRIAFTIAVSLLTMVGCRSEDRRSTNETPPSAVGGGPRDDAQSREGVIDRLAHARCEARERCGAIGSPTSDHVSFSECVEIARGELRSSFGASTCDAYANDKVEGCARELTGQACGSETKLTDNCVESKLCR